MCCKSLRRVHALKGVQSDKICKATIVRSKVVVNVKDV